MVELAEIVRDVIASGSVKTSDRGWQALNAIMNCRTAALGGHLYRCNDCGAEKPFYNSCRDRHCPKCQGGETAKWLSARAAELLPVPYFHIVFTVPGGLHSLMLSDKAAYLNLLFKAVSKTINQVAKSNLKGKVGYFAILHTWNQKLQWHPHIHCVVPGVVIGNDGKVRKTRGNYFLPQKVLAVVFRGIFLKLLQKHCDKDNEILKQAASKEWIVFAKKPFAHPQVVLKYLSRYTHRIAISNSRISLYSGGQVVFNYKDRELNCKRRCSLKSTEFVRRFLLHILPKQFVRIRHYGFLANAKKADSLARIRKHFGGSLLLLPANDKPLCPCCGSSNLKYIKIIPKIRKPLTTGSRNRRSRKLPLVA